ncbi:c-type cytochrome [Massilia sp. PAMC28688]|uniref:cytochrome-c peroxidase n=1 Tax=Massilia sp. PAMC28688 TaxID=2861283 RepID=UPI001C6293C5|nr:cytochrome c peroxidase [Massilia sp. PAMC28688]QYF94965.1 c-type cytochrome [Massilia sp. PAMC28688]
MRSPWHLAATFYAICISLCTSGVSLAQPLLAEPIRPLRAAAGLDPARVALGRALFHDLRLSRDNTQTCASCHKSEHGGADGLARSLGPGGILTRFNTPTVYNSVLNYRQGWLGASGGMDAVLEHVFGPAGESKVSPWVLVASRLTGDEAIAAQFSRAYGEEISPERVQDALSHYLRSLLTPSRFDRYLAGEHGALSPEERAGYARFKSFGCVSCHQGVNAGGNMFQRFGAMRRPVPGAPITADPGRYSVTGREADRHMLRVPGLRNVAQTAPYFHNGSVSTLKEAVDAMFKYQLGREASAQDRDLIVRFLHSLSGESKPASGATP